MILMHIISIFVGFLMKVAMTIIGFFIILVFIVLPTTLVMLQPDDLIANIEEELEVDFQDEYTLEDADASWLGFDEETHAEIKLSEKDMNMLIEKLSHNPKFKKENNDYAYFAADKKYPYSVEVNLNDEQNLFDYRIVWI